MCRWRKCRQLRPALARAIYRFILWLAGGIGAVITMSGVDSPFVSAEAAALGARCRFCGAGCGVSVNVCGEATKENQKKARSHDGGASDV